MTTLSEAAALGRSESTQPPLQTDRWRRPIGLLRCTPTGIHPLQREIHMVQLIRLALDRWQQREERGQTLVEYGLLLALIAIVVIAVLMLLGPAISGIFQSVNDQL